MTIQLLLMAFNFFRKGSMKGEKSSRMGTGLTLGSACRLAARLFQFIMGIVVIGLYATDLNNAHTSGHHYDTKWMYATVVGCISCLTSLVFMAPLIKAWFFFYADLFIFILYLTAFGIFGKLYIKVQPDGNKDVTRMKNAVWCLVVNMVLWIATASYGAMITWKARKASVASTTQFTGSSHV
jgi:hypothetical protein